MVRRLGKVCMDVDASIGGLNRLAAYAQKAVWDTFCNEPVPLAEFS